jgi:hypothetical protein
MGGQLGRVARRPPTLSQRFTPKPGDYPHHIHCRGCEDLLEVRAREAKVATPAEINAPVPLREATLHPCPQRILGFELRCPLALLRRLECLMVDWWADRELAGGCLGGRALPAGGTRATRGPVKPDGYTATNRAKLGHMHRIDRIHTFHRISW